MDRDEAREKAGEKLGELKDKTGEVLEELRVKGQEFLGKHEDTIESAIDKMAGFVDEQTKRKYHDKIETAAEKAKTTVERLAGDAGHPATPTDATGAAGAAAGAAGAAAGAARVDAQADVRLVEVVLADRRDRDVDR